MKRYKTGLTLGKFAPLHKGHERVINTALSECDEVYLMIYEDECIDIPVAKRAKWISELFPQVHILICEDGPRETGYTVDIIEKQNHYIYKTLKCKNVPKIDAFFSSEKYGEHVSKLLSCADRKVDEPRFIVPISATQIRKDVYQNRHFLSPVVYRDFIRKIVFLGAESTGKSTFAKAMAQKYNTVFIAEYGAEYWFKYNEKGKLLPEQLLEIAITHNKIEDEKLLECNRFMFVDTCNLTTYYYSVDYHGFALPQLEQLSFDSLKRYDLIVLCCDDIPYDDSDGRRGIEQRRKSQERFVSDLNSKEIPYVLITGSLQERIDYLSTIID